MDIKVKNLLPMAAAYMYLPIAIFFMGWLKIYIAIPAMIVLGIGIFLGIRQIQADETRTIYIEKGMLAAGVIIILFLCWQSGIGAFTGQAGDWHKHNAVMHDLIERPWPVIYETDNGGAMLSYYIGQYILPAVVGKMAGSFRSAEITQYIMAAVGLFLVWLLLIAVCRAQNWKKQSFCLLMLFFFGGMLVLGQAVTGNLYPENFPHGSYEWMNPETVKVQYSSNWSMLKWVPGQAIVPWMATALLLLKLDKIESYVMIGLSVIFYSGFAMVGLVAMMAVFAVYYGIALKNDMKYNAIIKKICSISNLILAIGVGSICILYFMGNLTGIKPESMGLHFLDYGQKKIFYPIFILFMFGGYALLIYKENKRNIVYFTTVIALCIYPLFSMGVYNDFTMRASIPALFTLMVLILSFVLETPAENITVDAAVTEKGSRGTRNAILVTLLLVGMLYPFLSVRESVVKNKIGEIKRSDPYMTLELFTDLTNPEIQDDFKYNYYSYDLEKDIFYQYLAR